MPQPIHTQPCRESLRWLRVEHDDTRGIVLTIDGPITDDATVVLAEVTELADALGGECPHCDSLAQDVEIERNNVADAKSTIDDLNRNLTKLLEVAEPLSGKEGAVELDAETVRLLRIRLGALKSMLP